MTAAPVPLVGRSAERALLARSLAAAATADPRLVVVEGVAGIGKTALLDDLAAGVAAADHGPITLTRVACDERERMFGYGLAGLILGDLLEPAESALSVTKRLLHWFGQQQTGDATAVLLIDDAHWMDPDSADALRFAVRRLRSDRVLVVIARRPPTSSDGWGTLIADQALTRVVTPAPLSADDVDQLLAQREGAAGGAVSSSDIVRATGGVPLLVHSELAAPGASGDRTVSPRSAVRQMLRGLSTEAVALIEALAVLAEPTSPSRLAAVALTADTFEALEAALNTTVVRMGPPGVDFSHALLRAAVYTRIPLPRQRELHRRAAAVSSGVRSLEHRVAAAALPDEALAAELIDAATTARRDNRPGQAAGHLMMAFSVTADPAQRDLLVLQALSDRLEAFDLTGAAELEPRARDARQSPLRSYTLGLVARDNGQVALATTLLRAAVDDATTDGDPRLASTAAIELARMHASLNEGPEILAAMERVAPLRRRVPVDLRVRITTMRAVGEWQSGRIHRAMEILDEMTPPDRGDSADADRFAARGMIRYFHGDLAASIEDLNYAISLSHLWRPSVMLDRAYVQRSLAHFLTGDWDAAALDAGTACAVADTGERPWVSALAHATAALVPANRGQWDVAEEHLEEAERANRRIRSTQGDGLAASAAAQLHALRGDHEKVLAVVAPVQRPDRLHRLQAVRSYRWLMIATITALTELGRLGDAEQQLRSYREMVLRFAAAPGPSRLGWLAGRVAQARGDAPAAVAAYEADLADPELARSPFTHAELLYDSGALQRRIGHRREGIDRLTRARAIFVQLRAAPFITRCDTELGEAGLQQPAAPVLGLTEREQDVAVLIAKGMTNNEIAADLYLTPKTIEYHLGNIYSKLQISGRRELRRRLTGG